MAFTASFRGRRWPAFTALLAIAASLSHTAGFASPAVTGSADAVRIDAGDASINEILETLAHSFDLKYKPTPALNKQLTGTYQGSLRRVIARVLEGHNYVLRDRGGMLELTILTPDRRTAHPAQATAKPAPQGAVNQAEAPIIGKPAELPVPTPSTAMPKPILLAQGSTPPMPTLVPGTGAAPTPVPLTADQSAQLPFPEVNISTIAPPIPKSDGPTPMPSPSGTARPLP